MTEVAESHGVGTDRVSFTKPHQGTAADRDIDKESHRKEATVPNRP